MKYPFETLLRPKPEVYTKFDRKRKDYFEFPVYKASDVLDHWDPSNTRSFRDENYYKAHNCIIEVEFSQLDSFTDVDVALMCLVVLTSDGEKGTLTHLTIPQRNDERALSITKFVNNLSDYWKTSVPVCLVGGEDAITDDYTKLLRSYLRQSGFVVTESAENNDLGGMVYRKTTLYKDRVAVKRKTYGGERTDVEIKFPKMEKTT